MTRDDHARCALPKGANEVVTTVKIHVEPARVDERLGLRDLAWTETFLFLIARRPLCPHTSSPVWSHGGDGRREARDNASLQALERAGAGSWRCSMTKTKGPTKKQKGGGERRAPSDGPRARHPSTKVGKAKGASKPTEGEGEYDAADVAFDASAGAKRERVGADSQLRATAPAASRRDPEVVVFSGDRPNLAASRAGALSEEGKRRAKRLFMSDSIARVHEVAKPKGGSERSRGQARRRGVASSRATSPRARSRA